MNDTPTETYYINSTIITPVEPAGTITGASALCAGSANVSYSIPPIANATAYTWTFPAGGDLVSGDNSPSVAVNYSTSAQSGNVTVAAANPCGTGASSSLFVTIYPLPAPVINGLSAVCAGSSGIIYTTAPGMTGYIWSITGGTITAGEGTETVTTSWNVAGAQSLSVSYTNSNLCSPASPTVKIVTVNPLPGAAGVITGDSEVCAGDNGVPYSIPPIADASSYTWITPGGSAIATGAGTNSITVNFTASAVSGDITVIGHNACGNGQASPAFQVLVSHMPAAAGTITGPDIVCAGTNGVIYSVPVILNAATYDWTVPAGAEITSGATSNQIVVSFSPAPGAGVITVKGASACGSGVVSPDFNVSMIASGNAPVVTAAGPLLTSSAVTGNQWYYEGTGPIAGATEQTYLATVTGWYWTVVMGVGCPFLESNHVYVLFTGQEELQNNNFSVFPVPNDGRFHVLMTTTSPETFTIQVYNQIGTKIFERGQIPVTGTTEQQIDIRPFASGIYSVVFLNNDHTVVRRVLVR
jgi:hypothetical protein